MQAIELHEARLVQELARTSAADAVYLQLAGLVPQGKCWTILSGRYCPSVNETRIVHIGLISRGTIEYPITVPQSLALGPLIALPVVEQGMEIVLLPGENMYVRRDVATAGSSMDLFIRFVESDLPYYSYIDPLKKIVNPIRKHGSFNRAGGISVGGVGGEGGGTIGKPGGARGGGGSEPI